jgi:formylglycine-generating enzyme required for sulfatase activity
MLGNQGFILCKFPLKEIALLKKLLNNKIIKMKNIKTLFILFFLFLVLYTNAQSPYIQVYRLGNVVYGEFISEIDSINFVDMPTHINYNVNGVSFDMISVSGGSLYIGNSSTPLSEANNVTLSDFAIGKYEVTQGLWFAVMGSYPDYLGHGVGANHPIYNLTWNEIVGAGSTSGYTINGVDYKTDGFCYKLSQLVGGDKQFCLPTEAQWEYAARGGQQTHGYIYAGSNSVDNVAWYNLNSGNTSHGVGIKYHNELGIYDMSGNSSEWCSDLAGGTYPYPIGTINPTGATSGFRRIYMGSNWAESDYLCTIFYKGGGGLEPYVRYEIGFRLALNSVE